MTSSKDEKPDATLRRVTRTVPATLPVSSAIARSGASAIPEIKATTTQLERESKDDPTLVARAVRSSTEGQCGRGPHAADAEAERRAYQIFGHLVFELVEPEVLDAGAKAAEQLGGDTSRVQE